MSGYVNQPFGSPPFPSLEVAPLNPASGLGEHCKLPQQGLGKAPTRNEFGAFQC